MQPTHLAASQASSGGIAGWAADLVETMGGPGAGLAIALENLFPPLPSEVVLPLTGFAAGRGVLSLASALFWTTLGSVVGAAALYWLGVLLGRRRLHEIWAKLPLVKTEDLERTEEWFARHGTKAVFLGRMVPVFRSLISVPAGVERMRLTTFLLLTTAGSLLWNSVLVLAGYWLGDQWGVVEQYVGVFSKAVGVLAVLALAVFVARRVSRRRSGRAARSRGAEGSGPGAASRQAPESRESPASRESAESPESREAGPADHAGRPERT